jgi:hypothetical protein
VFSDDEMMTVANYIAKMATEINPHSMAKAEEVSDEDLPMFLKGAVTALQTVTFHALRESLITTNAEKQNESVDEYITALTSLFALGDTTLLEMFNASRPAPAENTEAPSEADETAICGDLSCGDLSCGCSRSCVEQDLVLYDAVNARAIFRV